MDGQTMVFQYTHHSVSGGIIKSLIVDNITNCTNLYLSYIHMVHVHVYNTFKWIGDHKITTLLIQHTSSFEFHKLEHQLQF